MDKSTDMKTGAKDMFATCGMPPCFCAAKAKSFVCKRR